MKLEASYILKILFTCNFIISTANVLDSLLVNNLLFYLKNMTSFEAQNEFVHFQQI
jgi:hypothetical protein